MATPINPNEIAAWRWVSVPDLESEIAAEPDRFSPWMKMEWERMRAGGAGAVGVAAVEHFDMNVGQRNYNVCFSVFSALMGCALLIATQMPFKYSTPKPQNSMPMNNIQQNGPQV